MTNKRSKCVSHCGNCGHIGDAKQHLSGGCSQCVVGVGCDALFALNLLATQALPLGESKESGDNDKESESESEEETSNLHISSNHHVSGAGGTMEDGKFDEDDEGDSSDSSEEECDLCNVFGYNRNINSQVKGTDHVSDSDGESSDGDSSEDEEALGYRILSLFPEGAIDAAIPFVNGSSDPAELAWLCSKDVVLVRS